MEKMDIKYSVNGKTSSIYREISRVAEQARLQAFAAAASIGFEIKWDNNNLKLFLKTPEVDVTAKNELKKYESINSNEFKQIIIGDQVAYVKTSSEWKRVNFVKLLHSNRAIQLKNIEELIFKENSQIIRNSLRNEQYLTIFQNYELIKTDNSTMVVENNYNNPNREDLDINNIINQFLDTDLEKNNALMGQFFEQNLWFRLFYHFKKIFPKLSARQKWQVIKVFNENLNIFDKLKMFGYELLLCDNENIDYYSLKLLQDACNVTEVNDIQVHLAMSFFQSNFAESIIRACNETISRKQRMRYTYKFLC